jgi:hypothetical protein
MLFKFPAARNQHKTLSCIAAYFILMSFFAYSYALKTEATCSSENLGDFELTTQLYIYINLSNCSKISLIPTYKVGNSEKPE